VTRGSVLSALLAAGAAVLAAPRDAGADGTLSAWSSAAVDAGDLTSDTTSAMAGTSWGLSAAVNDTNAVYVQDDSPDDEPRYRARFYVDPSQFDPGTAFAHFRTRILIAFSDSPTRRVAAIVLRKVNGQYGIMGRARRDDNSQADTGFFAITAGPHAVEFDLIASTGPDASDGAFSLWIDGVLVSTLAGIDNSASAVDFARMGALSVKQGATGLLLFDEFESRRETYIGLEP